MKNMSIPYYYNYIVLELLNKKWTPIVSTTKNPAIMHGIFILKMTSIGYVELWDEEDLKLYRLIRACNLDQYGFKVEDLSYSMLL